MTDFKITVVFAVFACAVLILGTGTAFAQKQCHATGSSQYEITIKNELKFDIEIRFLKPDCTEDEGLTVGAAREIKVGGFEGHIYRIYENSTDRVVTEVVFRSGQLVYPISGYETSKLDPLRVLCSRAGDPRPMNVRNATARLIVIKFVKPDCVEQRGPIIAPGKQIGASTFVNNVFRAYDKESGKLLSQFPIRPTDCAQLRYRGRPR